MIPIIGFMTAYNEAEYIGHAIESTIDEMDEFFIVEGKFAESIGATRSDDDTINIINQKQQKYGNKIKIIQALGWTQLQQRSIIFNFIDMCSLIDVVESSYWLWLQDADEAYTKENIAKIKEVVAKTTAESIRINSYVFINDFKHYTSIKMPRLFYISPCFIYQFVEPNMLVKADNQGWYLLPEEEHEEIFFHHYAYCKSPERFIQKREERIRQTGTFKWNINEQGIIYADGVNIREFDGSHPEIMKTHWRYNG